MKKEITTMKKNTIIILDATHAKVTKDTEKQARSSGTPAYREWRAFHASHPGTEMAPTPTTKKQDQNTDATTKH